MTLNQKRAILFLLTFLLVVLMATLYHYPLVGSGILASFWRGPSLEQIKRDIIPPASKENEERKSNLREVCRKFRSRIPSFTEESFQNFAKFIIVDKERQIMYCPVPKAACTTWKAFFMRLRGVTVGSDIHTQEKTSVVHLKDLPPEAIKLVLRNFTKFMIVRHPFTRVLSAYRNKLEPNGSYETTHDNPDLKYYWRDRLGSDILKIYRGKETAKRFKEHREEYDLTFKEFVEFISDYQKLWTANNRHWKEMYSMCYPCDIEYDYIAKVETLVNDSLLFLVNNGLSTHVTNYEQHATHSSAQAPAVAQYYNKLPVESIEKLYRRYELDFRLFDYDPRMFG